MNLVIGVDESTAKGIYHFFPTSQGDINTRLLALDKTAAEAASELSEMGLDSSCACNFEPLTTLLYADPSGETTQRYLIKTDFQHNFRICQNIHISHPSNR